MGCSSTAIFSKLSLSSLLERSFSTRQAKKANTESKAAKGGLSGIKSKTEVKNVGEKKEIKQVTEEKIALAPS